MARRPRDRQGWGVGAHVLALFPCTHHHLLAMLGPSRPMPRVGARARVAHFGGGFEAAIVVGVHDEGRRLEVRCEAGEVVEFALSPASARFVLAGSSHGARLELLD
jgi:hypothetical protein